MESVRPATPDDCARLGELADAYRSEAGRRRGGTDGRESDPGGLVVDEDTADVSAYVTGDDRTALVGSLDEWVAGAALCRVHGPDRRGVLDLCYVEPGARQVGLGQLLLERSLDWFRAQGCTAVDGTALPGDRDAKQFFESAGFKARLLVMHLPLR